MQSQDRVKGIQGIASDFSGISACVRGEDVQGESFALVAGDLDFNKEGLTFYEAPQLATPGKPEGSTECGRWSRDW